MEAPQKPEFAVVDGKQIRITYCPAARGSLDLSFDRWRFDNAGISPNITRTEALSYKDNWQSGVNPLTMGKNGRVGQKKQQ